MAVGWMTALKLVPWSGVIEATPQLLQAARKLMGKTGAGTGTSPGALADADRGATITAAQQLQRLQDRIVQLEDEQQESARLIQSLAEQHARVVQAVAALRRQTRWLMGALVAVGLCCAGLLVWTLRQ